jgi:hypothetical protein
VRIETELSEVKIALNRLVIENEQLRADLSGTEKNLAGMRASLANTSAEAEIFKRQAAELKLRMEALGVNTASGNSARLEQRLLAAVASLQAASLEKRALTEALVRLSESASLFAKASTTVDPQSRLALETEIRNAGAALSGRRDQESAENPASLISGRAVSVKGDLALVVLNLGSKHGIRVGMPFQVTRGDKEIGSVSVVDVRDKIAGAVIQQLTSEQDPIKVGDHLKVAAAQ